MALPDPDRTLPRCSNLAQWPVLFLFGSETGNAAGLCHELHSNACAKGYVATIAPLNDFEKVGFADARLVIIVCSTSGDGDPPDNARKFHRWLKKKTHPSNLLCNLTCGVLALGDTNYTAFCQAGRTIHERLLQLGVKELLPRGDADDAVGLEAVVEPWKATLWDRLAGFVAPRPSTGDFPGSQADTVAEAPDPACSTPALVDQRAPSAELELQQEPGSATVPLPPVLFLYGSETGNSEGICHDLHREALLQGHPAQIACLNDWESVHFATAPLAVMVCSTTGDAEPPENARKFFRWLKKKTHPGTLLDTMQFAVLALGDTNYSGFCKAGRLLDHRLRQLGAHPLLERADADEAVGLELVVEPWRARLWPALRSTASTPAITPPAVEKSTQTNDPPLTVDPQALARPSCHMAKSDHSPLHSSTASRSSSPGLTDTTSSHPSSRGPLRVRGKPSPALVREETASKWSADHPFQARILRWTRMTTPDATSQVIHMTLSVPGWSWLPGDSIGIVPQNDAAMVRELLERLHLNPSDLFPNPGDQDSSYTYSKIPFPKPPACLTMEEVLTNYIDLYPKDTKVVHELSQRLPKVPETENEWVRLKEWLVDNTAFRTQVINRRATILDILRDMLPHSCPGIQHLIHCLKPLQPRYYSIASSPLQVEDELDIAFTLVNYIPPKANRRVRGVCTSWLQGICMEHKCRQGAGEDPPYLCIPIFLKPSHSFLLPANLRAPLIMIGPGTGVAPFVAFLQHRRKQLAEASQLLPPISPMEHLGASPLGSVCSKDDVSSTSTESNEGRAAGETHLFFGCRHRNADFLFRDQIEQFAEDSTLTFLHLALSQEGEGGRWHGGCYVQDKMMESSIRLCHLLLACKAHIYVCGDAQSLAHDVKRILRDILQEVEGLGPEEAHIILQHLTSLGRFHEDIY